MNDQARQLLIRLIRDYGIDLADDPQKLNALFKDYARGQFKREIFLCVQAAREGVVSDLQNNQHLPLDALSARLIKQLQDDCGFDVLAANWTIETWCVALDLAVQFGVKTPVIPVVPSASSLPTQTPLATPVSTDIDNSSSTNPPTRPRSVSLGDDDLTLIIEDGLSWLKKLIGWQYYINNGNGTATDSRTGLQWMRFSLGQYWNGKTCEGRAIEYNLQDALNAVNQLNNNGTINCGYSDWRIPTWDELSSIRETGSQVIDAKVFPNTPDGRFWTITESTPDLTGSIDKRFYTVNFNRFNAHYSFGTALAHDMKYIRLVR
jgi:hypothetical protein